MPLAGRSRGGPEGADQGEVTLAVVFGCRGAPNVAMRESTYEATFICISRGQADGRCGSRAAGTAGPRTAPNRPSMG